MIEVTPEDIRTAAYGITIPPGEAADTAIEKAIAKATDRVYDAFPTIDDRIVAGTLTEVRVAGVIEDMVLRVLRNPNAYRQVSIDDYTRMIDTALSSGELYLSEAERKLLTPRAKSKRIGSFRLDVPAWRTPGV